MRAFVVSFDGSRRSFGSLLRGVNYPSELRLLTSVAFGGKGGIILGLPTQHKRTLRGGAVW